MRVCGGLCGNPPVPWWCVRAWCVVGVGLPLASSFGFWRVCGPLRLCVASCAGGLSAIFKCLKLSISVKAPSRKRKSLNEIDSKVALAKKPRPASSELLVASQQIGKRLWRRFGWSRDWLRKIMYLIHQQFNTPTMGHLTKKDL